MRLKPYRRTGPRRHGRRTLVPTTLLGSLVVLAALNWPATDATGPAPQPASALQSAAPDTTFLCDVAYVNDGDTLRCKDGVKVRLHAVAAREADETCSPGHPCPTASGASATATLNRLTAGKTLTCEPTGRSYKRVTAICRTAEGEEINCAMIRSGTTLIWDKFDRQRPLCS
ncbi:thermonuclease family protein [Brevundimonas sp. NPDC003935]|uniref:thermonuclease family protein n=1 Tax=unclassified Brevundimonas TaxID=2622653 RepID=UPI0036A81CF1